MKWPVVHAECGELAFYTEKVWEEGEMISAEDVIQVDGTRPTPHSAMLCGSCGRNLLRPGTANLLVQVPVQ